MISRSLKNLYYITMAPVMYLNGVLYKILWAPSSGNVRVQLGPGQQNYLPGWINVDANVVTAKCDLWIDLRNRLPFKDGTVAAFYSYHVIEHLPDLKQHLSDIFRCLEPGGVYRVGGPNGDAAIAKFIENDLLWFGDFPDKRLSIGGKLDNFIFCRGEHLAILTRSMLEEFMNDVGFIEVKLCLPGKESGYEPLFHECLDIEYENDYTMPHTLIVEARKPY